MPALYHFVNYVEQNSKPHTKTEVQKIPGIISILPLEQNINKAAIPGTIFMGTRDDGLLSGELRIHDGTTLGGISIPPPGTVFHMLTKKGNNEKNHLAGALNLGTSYTKDFLESSTFFPKITIANTTLLTQFDDQHVDYEWFWGNTANLIFESEDTASQINPSTLLVEPEYTLFDGSTLGQDYQGFIFRNKTYIEHFDHIAGIDPLWRQDLYLDRRPLALAISKNVSCRYDLRFRVRALGISDYSRDVYNDPAFQAGLTPADVPNTLEVINQNIRAQVGALLSYEIDENGKEHTLTAIVSPSAQSSSRWHPFEIIYNYGKPDQVRIYHVWETKWTVDWGLQNPPSKLIADPASPFFQYGTIFHVKRDRGKFEITINAPGTDNMLIPELKYNLDIWNMPAYPWLKQIFNRDSGRYGFVANNRNWLFSDISFIDYEKDFETPEGYMFADGAVLDKRIYGALYSKIGDIWNTKSNLKSYEFQIPDLRGHFIRCYKNEYISGKLGARTRKEDTIRKHGHYTLVDDAGGHMHQYYELGINSTLDKPPITPEGTVLNQSHSILQAPGPDSWRGVWAVYANIRKDDPAAEDYFGRIDDVNIGVERIQGSNVPNQNEARHNVEDKFWNVPWKYKQYESKMSGGDIMEHGVDGEQYDDLSPTPDAVMLGEGTTFPLDIPQLHKHELVLGDSQKYPGDALNGTPNRAGWLGLGQDLPDGEGVPINIKIQTFIKY